MSSTSFGKRLIGAASSVERNGAGRGTRTTSRKSLEKWLIVLAVAIAVTWTLAMWGVYAILGLGIDALNAATGLLAFDPLILEWLTPLFGGAQQLGAVLVPIVWAGGLVLVLTGTWLVRRLVRGVHRASRVEEVDAG